MGLELEDKVGNIYEKKDDGSSTGDDEKARFAALLDGARLGVLQVGVEKVIVDALGHEIGGRNDERF